MHRLIVISKDIVVDHHPHHYGLDNRMKIYELTALEIIVIK